ncbi:MAG TPA: hypothetical protein PLT35_08075 [Vicinamibacterales bacterium]|nr:hypothetical protein [Vicinamibacterales bacterium]
MADLATMNERASGRYIGTLRDEAGTLLTAADLTAATLTLYDQASGTIVNSRSAQNVKNANGVTLYDTLQTDVATGKTYNLLWLIEPADNAIVGTGPAERRVALFVFTCSATKEVPHEVTWIVRNLTKRPA